jgi:hypothetical protein
VLLWSTVIFVTRGGEFTHLFESKKRHELRRGHNPRTGRWISQDPIGFDAEDANLYRYVHNAVTYRTDPTGLLTWRLWARDASKPRGGKFGAFSWGIDWELSCVPFRDKMHQNGVIVQEIKITHKVQSVTITGGSIEKQDYKPWWTSDGQRKASLHYLEAWEVTNGKWTTGTMRAFLPKAQLDGLFPIGLTGTPEDGNLAAADWWAKPRAGNRAFSERTEGWIQMEGWAYFYDGTSLEKDLAKNLGFAVGNTDKYATPAIFLPWLSLDDGITDRCRQTLGPLSADSGDRRIGVYRKLRAQWTWSGMKPPQQTVVSTESRAIEGGLPATEKENTRPLIIGGGFLGSPPPGFGPVAGPGQK